MSPASSKPHPANKAREPESSQIDKFKEAARELDCDDDERRFDERVKSLIKLKPAKAKPNP